MLLKLACWPAAAECLVLVCRFRLALLSRAREGNAVLGLVGLYATPKCTNARLCQRSVTAMTSKQHQPRLTTRWSDVRPGATYIQLLVLYVALSTLTGFASRQPLRSTRAEFLMMSTLPACACWRILDSHAPNLTLQGNCDRSQLVHSAQAAAFSKKPLHQLLHQPRTMPCNGYCTTAAAAGTAASPHHRQLSLPLS